MKRWSRRDVLKMGAAAAGACALAPDLARALAAGQPGALTGTARLGADPAGRERILLDRDWRFHLGHANDPSKDFDFGAGREYGKQAELFPASKPDFPVSAWRRLVSQPWCTGAIFFLVGLTSRLSWNRLSSASVQCGQLSRPKTLLSASMRSHYPRLTSRLAACSWLISGITPMEPSRTWNRW